MADIISIKFKIDGKEITATEKDLKDLQKATKDTEKGSKKASKGISAMGGAMAALGAVAAAAALGQFVAATVAAVKETENLARLAGLSTTEFQKQASAAKTVGVEADKLADIYKDVDDKLGDFVTTGAGPLADFFEGIGKQMGVTIDDFKELSSDQALGLYVSTLEDANASQAEMTFFMEAIASDASLLTPLLKDNGAAMKELGDAATGVLSEETIQKAAVLDQKFNTLAETIKGQTTLAIVDATTAMGEFLGLLEKPVKTEADLALEKVLEIGDRRLEQEQRLQEAIADGDEQERKFAEIAIQQIDIELKAATRKRGAIREEQAAVDELAAAEQAKADAVAKADQEARAGMIERDKLAAAAAIKEEAAAAAKAKSDAAEIEALRQLNDPLRTYVLELERIQELIDLSAGNPALVLELQGAYQKVEKSAKEAADEAARLNAEAAKTEAERLEDLAIEYELITDKATIYKDEIANIEELALKWGKSQQWVNEQIAKLGGDGDENPWAGLQEELNGMDAKIKEMAVDSVIGLAESFAQMAVSGEMNMKQMATAMLKQIAAVIVQALIMKAILSFTGGDADTGPAVGADTGPAVSRDSGGPGKAGDAFLIGTGAQPELFVPQTSGQFIPKQQMLAGMGGNSVNVGSINVVVKEKEGETSQEQADQISKAIRRDLKQMVNAEMINQQRSGNIFNPTGATAFK